RELAQDRERFPVVELALGDLVATPQDHRILGSDVPGPREVRLRARDRVVLLERELRARHAQEVLERHVVARDQGLEELDRLLPFVLAAAIGVVCCLVARAHDLGRRGTRLFGAAARERESGARYEAAKVRASSISTGETVHQELLGRHSRNRGAIQALHALPGAYRWLSRAPRE